MSKSSWEKIPDNPVLAKLIRDGAPDSMTFWGYVGPSRREGVVTLYPSVETHADSIEIAITDILHVEDVPDHILLFGAKVVWVNKDAKITRRHVGAAQDVGTLEASETDSPSAAKESSVEVSKGRLQVRVRTQGR